MIEQRAVTLLGRPELGQELSKQGNVELIDLGHSRNFCRIVAVMRQWMMRIRHANFGVTAVTGFAGKLESDDPGHVSLKRQELQIKHEPGMIGISRGNANGSIEVLEWVLFDIALGLLNSLLHVANGIEVITNLGPIRRAEGLPEPGDIVLYKVKQAATAAQGSLALGLGPAFAKQTFEHQAWMRLGWRDAAA